MEERAGGIELLILDVDGVMTRGEIIVNERGEEIKYFDVKDGHGIRMLMEAGIDVAIVSGRRSRAVEYRAKDLGIREIHLGVRDKGELCRECIRRKHLKKEQVCCMGDDTPDLPMFRESGLSVAVADAVEEVKDAADLVTRRKGGKGAVREVCELILKARQKRTGLVQSGV